MTGPGEDRAIVYGGSLSGIVSDLAAIRSQWRAQRSGSADYGREGFPSQARLSNIMEGFAGVLYPLRLGPDFVLPHNENVFVEQTLQTMLARLYGQIRLEFLYRGHARENAAIEDRASAIVTALALALPDVRRSLDRDVEAAAALDPAARSVEEVLICYPSIRAIIHYRIARLLFCAGAPLVARLITEIAHEQTGIDIHPGATIGESLFIDHGTGVVIGETSVIGDRVRLHQGVTLGGAGALDAEGADKAVRHPTIEDDVTVFPNATIIGPVRIGRGAIIGGNTWLTHDVPPGAVVTQGSATVVSG